MTTLTGADFPDPFFRKPRTEAVKERYKHEVPISKNQLAILKIPDLRFEQSYLTSIAKYIHTERISDRRNDRDEKEVDGVDGGLQVVGIDWGNVVWITFRDQLVSPLLQGFLWCIASQFIRPASSFLGRQFSTVFGLRSRTPPAQHTKAGGAFKERMKDWSKSAASGVETNVALAK